MFQEAKLHLYIHPAIQIAGIVLGYLAFYWGVKRYLTVHAGRKFIFAWKQHVLTGKLALVLWLIGIGVGLHYTRAEWNFLKITGEHYTIGMATIPFILATFFTGYWMDLFKKRRKYLCLVHGVVGTILCLLVFVQIITGVQVFYIFVWH